MSEHPHIVVVGAGIVGASIAWHLAAVEKANVTIVASLAGIGGTTTPNSWRQLTTEVPGLSDLIRWTGAIQWNGSVDEQTAFIEEHTSWGYSLGKMTNDEISELEPSLTDTADALPASGWAVRVPDEGSVEPALAARLFVEEAQKKGAKLVTGSVSKLLATDGKVTGLVLEDGTQIDANHVVVAAGLRSVPLCASVGVTLPAYPRPGLLAHTKPISKRLLNGIVLSAGPHLRQTTEGRIVIGADFAGGTVGSSTPDEQNQAALALVDKAKVLFRVEDAALLELDFYTVGERPQPKDGLPLVGASVVPGLAVAVMHSGVTLAAVVGELLAKAVVTNEAIDPILEAYSVNRVN
ncbi:hypothetical protein Sste5346_002391 [Sporothrix stenoceras]|uniref:FAD dependent oxidoreductase domain-containing protein n=1 Tax=Sporothrix stenoceras TaxID=5173 RepID=A0ABR3ZJ16_9PEZI